MKYYSIELSKGVSNHDDPIIFSVKSNPLVEKEIDAIMGTQQKKAHMHKKIKQM